MKKIFLVSQQTFQLDGLCSGMQLSATMNQNADCAPHSCGGYRHEE